MAQQRPSLRVLSLGAGVQSTTMAPRLAEACIAAGRPVGGTVLDPFAGSGTTLIAAEKTGRTARLVELDPGYCDVVVRRWQDWTGQAAILDGDGMTYNETADGAQRSPA